MVVVEVNGVAPCGCRYTSRDYTGLRAPAIIDWEDGTVWSVGTALPVHPTEPSISSQLEEQARKWGRQLSVRVKSYVAGPLPFTES